MLYLYSKMAAKIEVEMGGMTDYRIYNSACVDCTKIMNTFCL